MRQLQVFMTAEARTKAEQFSYQNMVGGEMQSFVHMLQKLHETEVLDGSGTEATKTLPRLMEIFERAQIQPEDTAATAAGKLWELYRNRQGMIEERVACTLRDIFHKADLSQVACVDLPDTQKFPIQATLQMRPGWQFCVAYDALGELNCGVGQWVAFNLMTSPHTCSREVLFAVSTPYGQLDYSKVHQLARDFIKGLHNENRVQGDSARATAPAEVQPTQGQTQPLRWKDESLC